MNIYEDLRPLQSRLRWWRVLAIALFLGLGARFWQLQVVRVTKYKELARANHVRQIPESAPRGLILDRYGSILAENRPSFNLAVQSPKQAVDTLRSLSGLLALPSEAIEAAVSESERAPQLGPALVKEDIPLEEVALVESRQLELPGALIQFVPRRFYPHGSLAAHVLGYVGRISEEQMESPNFQGANRADHVGQSGVELVYNRYLMGHNGVQKVVVNSRGRRERMLEAIPPLWGDSVQVSLDKDVQWAAEKALGDEAGAVVAIDPRDGEIVALASSPSFDPNFFSGRFNHQQWLAMVHDEEHRLQNRAIQGRYPAGSVFKLIMATAALEEGVITPSTELYCSGSVRLYGKVFHCHKAGGHGAVNLHKAIVQSCNSYFYQLGVKLQIETIARYARAFGLGSASGVDLPFEVTGLVPDPEWKRQARGEPWYAGETVSVAVGQGSVLVTALQMAQVAAIVGTSGEVYRPHVFVRRLAAGTVPEAAPASTGSEPVRHVGFQESTWQTLQKGMWGVVNEGGGTGWRARVPGVEVCGKTGTAQVASRATLQSTKDADRPEHLRNHAWFVGYAPRHNPEIAVAVLVEHGGAGGQAAALIAQQVLNAYFEARSRRQSEGVRQASLVRD